MDTYISGWHVVSDRKVVVLYRPGNKGPIHDHAILAPEGKEWSVDSASRAAEEYINSQAVAN